MPKALFAVVIAAFVVGAAAISARRMPLMPRASDPSMPMMYEISTRPWLYELSGKYGRTISTLRDIPLAELQAIQSQHVNYVWFMGIWHLGAYGLNHDRTDPSLLAQYAVVLPDYTTADIIGSPYAVTNYTVNPELGTTSDVAWLRTQLNNLGMKLILDFVPNHSACDSPWITTNINYYIQAPKGSGPPYDSSKYLTNGVAFGNCPGSTTPWTDTAQLNYWNQDTRSLMLQQLQQIGNMADGIRCDMAYIVLNDLFYETWSTQLNSWGWSRPSTEFWADAISQVKKNFPKIIFLAEVYGDSQYTLQSEGFDFTYDKELLDRLKANNLDYVRSWITGNTASFFAHSAQFIENHDEDRAVAVFGSTTKADAAAMVVMTLPGMRFYFQDQWLGYKNKLDVHLRRATSESAISSVTSMYTTLNSIISDVSFTSGTWNYCTVSNSGDSWRLMAWRWNYANSSKRLVVVNFSDASGSGYIVIPDVVSDTGSDTVTITELWTNTKYSRSVSEMKSSGLFVVVDAWSSQIFQYP
ncbi:alpha amylase, catalytic subfamily protein [Pelomyxa schiedti]|nr:alpha amylase, catalytic subfamily protein [Pelomyxa schiedti]